jgi:hypothetical protein
MLNYQQIYLQIAAAEIRSGLSVTPQAEENEESLYEGKALSTI